MIIGIPWQKLAAILFNQQRTWASEAGSISSKQLRKALLRIPKADRIVYLLHACDGIGLDEIGRRLQLSPSEVERHLSSALTELDRQIGGNSSGDAVANRRTAD